MKVNILKIKSTDLENKFGKMENIMKECGKIINLKVMENLYFLMEEYMKDNFKMIWHMEKENF
jgi:hypothetical protein